ncbi:hypothetical protein OHW80_06805 [Acinetobacter baumannii]|nr:hypothetical protein [Acinetobacter baumannii]
MSFSGCNTVLYGETKPQTVHVSLEKDKGTTIFVWSPKNNAAISNREGKGCIQGADVFHNEDVSVDISNKLLELVNGIALSKNTSAEDKLVAIDTVSKIVQLKTNTERNTYLSLGMFGLCQLNANGGLSNAELLRLVGQLIEISAKIGTVGK